jgi:rRNA maturation endonuclease Nob1
LKSNTINDLLLVANFARKTGDFAALSKTDLKLIALTYMLEKEVNGSVIPPNLFINV